ncbi:MAG TPA: NAD(P)/FAD-dependent oxidoreductase, partial [Candidatus Binatia bacterium]|nr:NAD(P)/FAD-dependent oxidoreductase [Candidatus Binatia bacterium]
MAIYDAIIVGAGHNGLVTAAYLAKAGKKILVLEQRPAVGGIAGTEEVFAGFKYSTCAHLAGSFSNEIVADLDLKKHGFELLPLDPLLFAPALEENGLLIKREPAEAAAAIARHSKADSSSYPAFCALTKNLSAFLRTLYSVTLPDKANPGNFNAGEILKIGWKFHRLGEKEMYEFLRILPMSTADLLNEWFENDALKAALAGSSMLASFVGPRQQGTAFNLLHHQQGESNGALRTAGFIRGGIGHLPQALARAAQHLGAEIRTGSEVVKIVTKHGAATGVALRNGDELNATTVISNADVKRTF